MDVVDYSRDIIERTLINGFREKIERMSLQRSLFKIKSKRCSQCFPIQGSPSSTLFRLRTYSCAPAPLEGLSHGKCSFRIALVARPRDAQRWVRLCLELGSKKPHFRFLLGHERFLFASVDSQKADGLNRTMLSKATGLTEK